MRVLVACEESQTVCKAFRKKGHEAYSCDIIDCSGGRPEWHIKDDVINVLNSSWDMILAFPPCTYLCSSGLHWNKRITGRQKKTEQALQFVEQILNADCEKIAIENPIGCISTRLRKFDQIIQPYEFGHSASKKTCLWLKGLPKLKPTKRVKGRFVNGKERFENQTDSGQNKLGPSEDRAILRSKTYQGIADAMAEQWGGLCFL